MKNMRFIPISTVAAAVVLLATSCVKNTLYNTPHPNHGKIAVTVDWSGRGAGLDLPALWMVSLGDYTGTERSATHAPEQLFTPGEYTLAAWNPMEKIAVAGTTATVATVPGNGSGCEVVHRAAAGVVLHQRAAGADREGQGPHLHGRDAAADA